MSRVSLWRHRDVTFRRSLEWTLYISEIGTVAKGWMTWLNKRYPHFEIEFALGGEDNMIQAGIVIPYLSRCHVGIRVPRWLTKGWIYQRREWTLRVGYIGRWVELLLAYDDSARDMRSYYTAMRKRGESLDPWNRVSLWPGIHINLTGHPRDRLLGRKVCTVAEGEPQAVVVPMPEGNYQAVVTVEKRTWKRPRWPWPSNYRTDYSIDIPGGIPVPGKGENSWDCEDDAIHGTGGKSVHDAVANATRAALRQRELYAGPGWEPDRGWPVGIAR
jgi:hypothetical protein